MVVAARLRRANPARRRAVHNNARRRRDSLRGYPDLHQTHRIPVAGSLSVPLSFPRGDEPVTFKARVDVTQGASPTGTLFTLGGQGSVGFSAGSVSVTTGGSTFTGSFVGAPRESAEIVVAIRPTDGQLRVWVDSDLVIAGEAASFPYSWATTGSVAYDSFADVGAVSDLDAFVGQLPRHFDEAPGTPVGSTFDELLYIAARATFQTSEYPFTGEA